MVPRVKDNRGMAAAPNRGHLPSVNRGHSTRAASYFGMATAALAAITILGGLIFALTEHPFRAAITLGTGVALMGIMRGAWPGRTWYSSRSRWWDVTVFVGVGLAIIIFAPLVGLGAG